MLALTAIAGYFFIFFARVIDVSLATIRLLFVVRGRKIEAAVIGFFEVMIFVAALGRVMGQLDNWFNILAYAGGFATGSLVGGLAEERLALGFVATQIISLHKDVELRDAIRGEGFGLTVITGQGKDGERHILLVVSKRKDVPRLTRLVESIDDHAVVVMTDARRSLRAFSTDMRKGK